MYYKHAWWAWAVKNSVCVLSWTALAIWFNRWWIALFAALFLSGFKENDHRHFVCDCCGRLSPEGASIDEAEQRRIDAGWTRQRVGGKWRDICPDCQSKEDVK